MHSTGDSKAINICYARDCAAIAQLGERQTEDLKVPGSIPGRGNYLLPTTGVSFLCNVPGDDVKHNRCMQRRHDTLCF